MNTCTDPYFLSTIACKLSEYLSKDELEILAANLKVLSEMLKLISAEETE